MSHTQAQILFVSRVYPYEQPGAPPERMPAAASEWQIVSQQFYSDHAFVVWRCWLFATEGE